MSQTERGLPGVTRVDAKLFFTRLTEHKFVHVDSGLPPRHSATWRVPIASCREHVSKGVWLVCVLAFSIWLNFKCELALHSDNMH